MADYDRDGKLDLYVTRTGPPGNLSWLEGAATTRKGNRLFRNLGDWQFEDVTKKRARAAGTARRSPPPGSTPTTTAGPTCTSPTSSATACCSSTSSDGTFAATALADRPADFGTMGLAVGDVDNDGHIDIYCANMYSKAGTRVIGNLKPDAYPPKVMEKFRRFVAGSQLHLNKGGVQVRAGRRGEAGRRGRLGLRRRPWPTWTTTAGSTSTPRPGTSAATAPSRMGETASGWLSCHSLATATATVALPGQLDAEARRVLGRQPVADRRSTATT